jgi:hypothetical protein
MLRPSLDDLPASRIREVANAGIGRDDVRTFWFGEGDLATLEFIRRAAIDEGVRRLAGFLQRTAAAPVS